jgi:hypothetical protein
MYVYMMFDDLDANTHRLRNTISSALHCFHLSEQNMTRTTLQ